MKHLVFALLILLPTLAAIGAEADVSVSGGYVRGLPPSLRQTAAYMTLRNHSEEDLLLVGSESPVAVEVSLHESVMEDGVMSMRHVADARLPAGGQLALAPGRLHLMLTGLRRALAEGDEVALTLRFDDGSEKQVTLPVRDVRDEEARQ